jgi:hypothetical protein
MHQIALFIHHTNKEVSILYPYLQSVSTFDLSYLSSDPNCLATGQPQAEVTGLTSESGHFEIIILLPLAHLNEAK